VSGADEGPVPVLAQRVVAKRAGPSANAAALAAAAERTYRDLGRVAAPLIGQAGIEALMRRAVHLARRQYPWLTSDDEDASPHGEDAFAQVVQCLGGAEPGSAADAAGAVFAVAAALLATLIGEGLTASLLYRAWPDAFPMPVKRSEHE
jgi:hypothetical protein